VKYVLNEHISVSTMSVENPETDLRARVLDNARNASSSFAFEFRLTDPKTQCFVPILLNCSYERERG
jgi:hypothetical protein